MKRREERLNTEFTEDAQRSQRRETQNPRAKSARGTPWREEQAGPPEGGRYAGELVRWRRGWGAHEVDKHPIESFEIGINQNFDTLELAFRLVPF
jgi:hypothetical protein